LAARLFHPLSPRPRCNQHTQVIECNLRASRTFPFISKTLDCNFITLATRVMLGVKAVPYNISLLDIDYVAVKVSSHLCCLGTRSGCTRVRCTAASTAVLACLFLFSHTVLCSDDAGFIFQHISASKVAHAWGLKMGANPPPA